MPAPRPKSIRRSLLLHASKTGRRNTPPGVRNRERCARRRFRRRQSDDAGDAQDGPAAATVRLTGGARAGDVQRIVGARRRRCGHPCTPPGAARRRRPAAGELPCGAAKMTRRRNHVLSWHHRISVPPPSGGGATSASQRAAPGRKRRLNMARDLNKVMLTGHLGADPEMRFTPQGSAVTTFRVASNRPWKSGDGVQHEDTEWFRIVAWDKLAEICNEYLKKGTRVYIEGRLQTRSWDDRDTGEKRYITEVVAQDMIILTPKGHGDPAGEESPAAPARPAAPAAPPAAPAAPARRNAPVPIGDDDLPF
jgi:single-strand DNA-binding protein